MGANKYLRKPSSSLTALPRVTRWMVRAIRAVLDVRPLSMISQLFNPTLFQNTRDLHQGQEEDSRDCKFPLHIHVKRPDLLQSVPDDSSYQCMSLTLGMGRIRINTSKRKSEMVVLSRRSLANCRANIIP